MPIQPPQWTEFLSCPVCYKKFNDAVELPISLGCGHTVCKACLLKLHQKKCPFDQNVISRSVEELPVNLALLQLVGATIPEEDSVSITSISENYKFYESSRRSIADLASHLKCLATGSGQLNTLLSRPMQRKLVTIINCQLVEEEGRVRAMRSGRSLGERTVTELILQHQNPSQLSTNLWAAIRARGCQFLGPAMQEEVLKLILLALEDGSPLSRKVLVLFVVQRLESQYPQASKTAIGHVVQLLYRASCFKVTKREEDSSLMQLKEEFRTYECLRREHDSQIVQIATEAGLRIAPEQWSSLLYGDTNHKSHMQSIIDKLQTPQSFSQSVNELVIALQRTNDQGNLTRLRPHLELLTNVDPSAEAPPPSWENLEAVLQAVKTVVQGLVDFLQFHSQTKPEIPQLHNTKYKTSLCRDLLQRGACPRGDNCTFAHSQDELERARGRNKKVGPKTNLIISPMTNCAVLGDLTSELQTNLSMKDSRPHSESDNGDCSEDVKSEQLVTVQTLTAPVVSMAPSMTPVPGVISSMTAPSLVPSAHLGGQCYPQSGHMEYEVASPLHTIPGVPTYPPTHQPYLPENLYISQQSVPAYQHPYMSDGSTGYPVPPQTMGYTHNIAPTNHPYPSQYISVYDQRFPAPGPYGETWKTSAPPYYPGQEAGFTQPLPPRYSHPTNPYPQRMPYSQQPKPESLDDLHSRRKEILVHLNKETPPVTLCTATTRSSQQVTGTPATHPCYSASDGYILPPRQPSMFHYNPNQTQVSYQLAKSVADTYATSRSTSTLANSVDKENLMKPMQKYSPWSSCEMTEPTSDTIQSMSNTRRDSENPEGIGSSCPSSVAQTLGSKMMSIRTDSIRPVQTSMINQGAPEVSRSRSFSFLDDDFFIPFDPPIVSKYGPISRTARANLKSSDPVHVTAENACLLVTPVTAVTPTARPYPISAQSPSRFNLDGSSLHSDTRTLSSLMSMPRMSAGIVGVSVTTDQPYTPGIVGRSVTTGQPYTPGIVGRSVSTGQPYAPGIVGRSVTTGPPYTPGIVGRSVTTGQPYAPGIVGRSVTTGQPYTPGIVGVSVTTGQPYTLWDSQSYFQNSRPTTVEDRLQHELAKVEHQIQVQENSTRELSQQEILQCELKAIEQQISMKTGKTPNASLETFSSHRTPSRLMSTSKIPPLRLGQVLDPDIDLNTALTPEELQELKELHLSVDLNKRDIERDDRSNQDVTIT